MLAGGACVAAVVLAAGVLAHAAGRPWQSVMFVVLGLAQLGVALAVRAKRGPGATRNRSLLAAVALAALLQVAGVLVAPLQVLLGTESLTMVELFGCALVAVLPGAALRLLRRGRA